MYHLFFVCVGCTRLVLNQRFYTNLFTAYFCMRELSQVSPQPTFYNGLLTAYFCMCHLVCKTTNYTSQPMFTPLTFVCEWHSWLSPIFVCITLHAKRQSRPLNQCFSMTFSPLIFVCTLYLVRAPTCFLYASPCMQND